MSNWQDQFKDSAERFRMTVVCDDGMYRQVPMGGGTWRVQWFSRADVDRPEYAAGYSDFLDESAAREHFDVVAPQLASKVWRAELQYRPPVPGFETVERSDYLGPSAEGGEPKATPEKASDPGGGS